MIISCDTVIKTCIKTTSYLLYKNIFILIKSVFLHKRLKLFSVYALFCTYLLTSALLFDYLAILSEISRSFHFIVYYKYYLVIVYLFYGVCRGIETSKLLTWWHAISADHGHGPWLCRTQIAKSFQNSKYNLSDFCFCFCSKIYAKDCWPNRL